jgi:hypothetical protein
MTKRVYAESDSLFMAGDTKRNPYLFATNGWSLTFADSTISRHFLGEEIMFNTIATRHFPAGTTTFFSPRDSASASNPLTAPTDYIGKRFRWFVTYHTYEATFRQLNNTMPIPLDSFLTQKEQRLWMNNYDGELNGMNGAEIYRRLDQINDRIMDWYNANQYAIRIAALNSCLTEKIADTTACAIYKEHFMRTDITTEILCAKLDSIYGTRLFSDGYANDKESIDREIERRNEMFNMMEYAYFYKVVMPGRLIGGNSLITTDDTAEWKIDALRLAMADYTVRAESRTINVPIIALTVLIVICVPFIVIRRKRRG